MHIDGSMIGSARWIAPETTSKHPEWTPKADIFSFGMVMYEIASRKIPFEEVADNNQVYICFTNNTVVSLFCLNLGCCTCKI